jgi:predicted tellurium resistance membrane protein TerC
MKEEKRRRGKQALKGVLKFVLIPVLLLIILNWKWALTVFLIFFLKSMFTIWKRKYFAKDIEGNKLSFKQFMKRWKEGIEGITPLQQAKTSVMGTWIIISGLIGGISVMAIVRPENTWWWFLVILGGSLIVTCVQMIGGLQKLWKFKEQAKIQKQFEESMNKLKKKPKKKKKSKIEVKFNKVGK